MNHFNNWLIHSTTIFNLAIDVILKRILIQTNWIK